MKKDNKITVTPHTVVGTKQVLRGVTEGSIRCVIVASDADESIRNKIVGAATKYGAKVSFVPSMVKLGESAGIDVAAACIGFPDENASIKQS